MKIDTSQNRLLNGIPADELERHGLSFQKVTLVHGDTVIKPDAPIDYIYFPLNCLLSMITVMEDGSSVESGVIGREGMSGIPVLLDATQTTMWTVTQIPGDALKVRSSELKKAYDASLAVKSLLNRYIHTVVVVGSQSAACNALHDIRARLSRWLLMSSDGIGSEELGITQEYLAIMLGVRRASVSEVAMLLQQLGLISYSRGRIRIINRTGLESVACECYHRVKDEYERLFAGTGSGLTTARQR